MWKTDTNIFLNIRFICADNPPLSLPSCILYFLIQKIFYFLEKKRFPSICRLKIVPINYTRVKCLNLLAIFEKHSLDGGLFFLACVNLF